jgi:hypothetical protein
MPITLNNSNISVTYNTGSNYIIETVKSDLYVRDTVGTTSNLSIEPTVNPYVIVTDAYYPKVPSSNSATWTDSGYTVTAKVSDAVLNTAYVYYLFNHIITTNPIYGGDDYYHSQLVYNGTGNTYTGATRFKTFAGIAISVDYGRSIYPTRMRIGPHQSSSNNGGFPKAFKIFASDDASCWNNNNHSSWTQIYDRTTTLTITNGQYTIVNFTANLPKYRYYTMVVLSVNGNYAGGYMTFAEWNIGGDEKIDAIPEGNPITHKTLNFTYVPPPLIYDFTNYNTRATWLAYAATIPTFTTSELDYMLDPFDPDSVFLSNTRVGWVQMTLPSTHNFFTITYGLGTQAVEPVRLLVNGVIKSTYGTINSVTTYSQAYNVGDVVRIEETLSTMSANFIFQFTNTNSTTNTYTLTFPVRTLADVNNNSNLILQGDYNVNVGHPTSSLLPAITNTSNTLIPLPTTTTSNIFVRYHTLNPVKTTEGAQWTYSSTNPNVYHLGSVGIGTTSPQYSLDVRGNIFTSVGGYTQSGTENWIIQSDRRIKENIVKASYEKCLENVKKIELYNFNFKENYVNTNDRNQLGFIAQEVQEVYPKAVIVKPDEKIEELLTVNTTQIKYTLYGAVRSLIEKVERIEERVDKLYKLAIPDVEIKEITSKITEIFESTSNIILPAPNIP